MPHDSSIPSVSIIIAAYNASATIARAVRSALAESKAAEVIVVDDASTDDTAAAAIAADDGSGRLKILMQPHNAGPSAARNRAIQESTSSWIGILDADDFFLPERIAQLLTFANEADFIADDAAQVVEGALGGPYKSLLGTAFASSHSISFSEFVLSDIAEGKLQSRGLGFIKPLMRRDFLTSQQLRYRESMRLGEDYELYARALASGARLVIVPAQGYVSVLQSTSLSSKHSDIDLLRFRNCDNELAALPGLKTQDRDALRRHYLSVDCRLQWRLLINAVKEKNICAAIATFLRPWPVPFYLLTQLNNEFGRRISVKIKGRKT